jgi:ketosteroid isomerase-like protein
MNPITRDQTVQAVHNLFIWLNGFSGTDKAMTLTDIERLFAPDAPMTLNGRHICSSRQDHLRHGQDLQAKMKSWRFNVPFERTLVEGNTVVGYYTVDFVSREGVKSRAYDLCIWTVEHGKIASVLENVIFEAAAIDVKSFA